MEHPDRVSELICRGIFLFRQREIDWLYQGPGASVIFPEEWQKYVDFIPMEERRDFMKAYTRRLLGDLGEEVMYRAAVIRSHWQRTVAHFQLVEPSSPADVRSFEEVCLVSARLETHYSLNHGFFPRDGYLLEKDNLDKIRHIPMIIVQGRYDMMCPPVTAHELHTALPHSEIYYTMAGHSGFDTENIKYMVLATEKLKNR